MIARVAGRESVAIEHDDLVSHAMCRVVQNFVDTGFTNRISRSEMSVAIRTG